MFCRSCWANIPDDVARCPRCQADPRVEGTPAPAAGRAAPAAAPAADILPPKKRGGLSLARLDLWVGVLLAVLGGAYGVQWLGERRAAQTAGTTTAGSPSRPALARAAGPAAAPAAPIDGAEAALSREAYQLYQQGKIAEACDKYREVADRQPDDGARRNLGTCLARLGRIAYEANQTQLAIGYYERAIDASPRVPDLWIGLALAHLKGQDYGRAHAVLEQATRSFPDDAKMLYALAEVQERQGRSRDAAGTLRRVLAMHPGHTDAKALLARVEREQTFEGSYWSNESAHFVVRYEGAGGIDIGRSVVDTLEAAHDSIGRDLNAFPSNRVQVGVYRTEVLGEVIGVPAHFLAGAFDGHKIRLNLAQSTAYSNSLERLVRHEYGHAAIHIASKGRAPIWVHEGLAQMLEPRSAPRHLDISVPREYLTLSGIERMSRTMHPAVFTAGYGLTHAAVEYMIDRGGMSAMREFLARLGQGDPLPQAMRHSFGFGPEEVEARILAVAGKG